MTVTVDLLHRKGRFMIINKKIAAIAAASTVVLTGSAWAIGASKEPEVVTETKTNTTTEPPVTNTKTKTNTVTKTHTPPARTVTETQVARSADRTPVEAPKATTNAAPTPAPPANTSASQPPAAPAGGIASCIAKYESGGNPKAENPSGASGLYQFMPGTWTAVTGLPPPASNYSVSVQTDAFHKLWNNGAGASHWVTAHKCGY